MSALKLTGRGTGHVYSFHNYLLSYNEVKTDILLAFEQQFDKLSLSVNYLTIINKVKE